jgi:spoIIIJ-associated protein
MHVEATVTATLSEPDDITGRRIAILEIRGNDLGVLIGTRGETLNAIQYLMRLMVGHKLRQRADFVIDVEGYRQRREQALARLAERMADKVIKRGRPVSLEPMPPHERRIIHVTLRDYDEVTTHSVGEGKRRKVRILPK